MKTLILTNKFELEKVLNSIKQRKINFIPTMGNLHEGHFELIRSAKKNGNINLVSIYINPLQFNDKKDFDNYPRSIKKDLKHLKELKVSMVYLPEKDFNLTNTSIIDLGEIVDKLCGKNRKGHFEGVATIILKFLLIIKPEKIFLGEKDFQQILVIKKVIKDFNLSTNVKTVPIVRGHGGIALSSRNQRIKNINNLEKVYNCLVDIKNKIDEDNFCIKDLKYFKDNLIKSGICRVNYLEILKESDLSELTSIPSKSRIFISCNIQGVNVIDNLGLEKNYLKEYGKLKFSS
ncbi:MAG: pantoate--beta-alanine ligase [Rickettsiales bacterium]|nr:pantoate--beta-alanine ligase [Rickettsiales bacterium]OUT43493.1 MAG: pantoate--beta-alanine ligase [Pelagibacteraceae bacterium TMED13]|tara:strand:- start:915 stop:1784 length:870 start_codon:yes stop_codon:yes gene_type:complete